MTYTRRVFVSAPKQLIVVRLEVNQPGALDARITMTRPQDAVCVSKGENSLVLRGQIDRKHHSYVNLVLYLQPLFHTLIVNRLV